MNHDFTSEIVNAELIERYLALLGTLSPREQEVIKRRFGLEPYQNPESLARIGFDFGVSKERIRQIQYGALRQLRATGWHLEDYSPTRTRRKATSHPQAKVHPPRPIITQDSTKSNAHLRTPSTASKDIPDSMTTLIFRVITIMVGLVLEPTIRGRASKSNAHH